MFRVEEEEECGMTEAIFADLISAVILKACEDYLTLNPFSTRKANEFYWHEGHAYKSAEVFLFDEVPAFGDLGWTFEDACDYLDLNAKKIRLRLIKDAVNDTVMPTNHQLDLFG